MEQSWKIRRASLLAAICLVAAATARGDTIFLKNGRRIIALSVTEEGQKITYETASGTLSLPRSIVDHIERGTVPSLDTATNPSTFSLKSPETEAAPATLPPKDSETKSPRIQKRQV